MRVREDVKMNRLHSLFALALTLAFLLSSCALPRITSRTVYEDPTNFIRVEADPTVFDEIPATVHAHPVSIDTRVMADILRGFSVREHRNALQRFIAGEAPREPVFRKDEIDLLADRIVEGLAQATPYERVTFYLSRPQTSIKREITSGGLYVSSVHLHFILGNHRIIYGIPAYGMVYDRRYPTMPISAKGFDLFFEPARAVVLRPVSLWDRMLGHEKDETVIDLSKLGSSGSTARWFSGRIPIS